MSSFSNLKVLQITRLSSAVVFTINLFIFEIISASTCFSKQIEFDALAQKLPKVQSNKFIACRTVAADVAAYRLLSTIETIMIK